MLDKEILISIFRLRFIGKLSLRKISADLKIHRDTVSRYDTIMKKNLSFLKLELIELGTCDEDSFDMFIKNHWKSYIDRIISFTHTRMKRVLTDDIVKAIHKLSEILDTTSPTEIYDYIGENLSDSPLYNISYSSIRRALLKIEK